MPVIYNLPCPFCKSKLHVDSSQSGLDLPCPECGKAVNVPTLRGLQKLEVASQADTQQVWRWGAREGLLVVAVILILTGLICSYFTGGFSTVTMQLSDYPAFYPDPELSLEETWIYFRYLEKAGLSSEPEQHIQKIAMQHEQEKLMAWALLSVAGVGCILAVIAVTIFRTKTVGSGRRRRA
ncbi:MAG: hypothetical protein MPJ50_07750 [Pirellulales bacterium]|nr:hypothetical protein [Pirellulales bacterium]